MLSNSDKLFLVRCAKKEIYPFLSGMVRKWNEDGIEMGIFYAIIGDHTHTLYEGKFEDVLEWQTEAYVVYNHYRTRFDEVRDKEVAQLYRELVGDI